MRVRRWCWLYLWVLSLAVISCFGGSISYGFFFGITLVPVISMIYLAVVYIHLKIYQKAESRNMVCGQPMPYFFVLQNDSPFVFAGVSVRLYSSFSYVEELPGDREYELLPGEQFTFETRLACKYRGEYEVGVKEIVITDFFRLFRISYRAPGAVKAIVIPKVVCLEQPNSVEQTVFAMQRETYGDCAPDLTVRDYVKGDAVKQIHWKATAREGKLKVRNRTGEEKQGIFLLWETRRPGREPGEYLPVENKILEVVLALGFFMAQKGVGFCACWGQGGVREQQVEGIGAFDEFYQTVSRTVFDVQEEFGDLLCEAMGRREFSQGKGAFCVVSRLDDNVMRLANEMDQAGLLTVFYVITDENMEDYVRQGNERKRIVIIPVEAELARRL